MLNSVIKSDGKRVPFDPERLRKWSTFAAVKGVSWSEIELEAVKRCYDGISTRDLHNAMIDACIDKKDQKYSDMAGRLLLGQIYKEAHGGFSSIPSLGDFYQDMVDKNHWEQMDYSAEDLNKLGKLVKHDKNLGYGYSVLRQMSDKYMLKDVIKNRVHESPQFAFMGIAMKLMEAQPKERRLEDVAKTYGFISDLKINLPSPYLTGIRTNIKGAASCCLFKAGDNADSLAIANYLAHKFTIANSGIGVYMQTRSTGDGVKNNRIKHSGLLPYYRWMQGSVTASKQASRGGSATVTYSSLEPDFEDLIRLKHPTTPVEKKIDQLDYSVVVNHAFLRRAAKNLDWMLVSYKDAPELYDAMYLDESTFEEVYDKVSRKRINKKVVKARDMLQEIINQQLATGRIYLFFADNVNKHTPFKDTVWQSNLCQEVFLPTKPFYNMSDLDTGANTDKSELALCFLASIVAGRVKPDEYEEVAYYTALLIDNVIDFMDYPFYHTEVTAKKRRSIGVGITNLAHYLASNGVGYGSKEGKVLMHELAERHYYYLARASLRLAKEKGVAEWMDKTKWVEGWTPLSSYSKSVDDIADFKLHFDWKQLQKDIVDNGGIRNSVLVAIAPNESSSLVSNTTNSLYPIRDHMMYKQSQKGNVLFIVPEYDKLKNKYEYAWDVSDKDLMETYGIFTKFADQGISCDSYIDYTKLPDGKVSIKGQMQKIMLAAKLGVKSLYYLNSKTKSADSLAGEIVVIQEDDGCDSCKL